MLRSPAVRPQPPARATGLHLVFRGRGEASTVDLLKSALYLLASEIEYRVPAQELRVSLSHIPALPASGFVIDSVRVARATQ
jgi:hypothetical protein